MRGSVRVSVVVPTRNCEDDIADLLESLRGLGDVEVIVVDYSDDQTPEVAGRYGFVRVIRAPRPGLNLARNLGLREAQGEVVAFTDCDCVVPRDWIANILRVMRETGAACVGGSALNYRPGRLFTDYANEAVLPLMPVYRSRTVVTAANFFVKRPPPGNNMAFLKRVAESYLFDEEYRYGWDEVDLMWRLCRDGHAVVADPSIVVYHKHRERLGDLLRQEFRYGRGHVYFTLKNPDAPISWVPPAALLALTAYLLLVLSAPRALLLIPVLYLALFAEYRFRRGLPLLKSLAYPLLDYACHLSYLAGYLVGLLTVAPGRLFRRLRARSRPGCSRCSPGTPGTPRPCTSPSPR